MGRPTPEAANEEAGRAGGLRRGPFGGGRIGKPPFRRRGRAGQRRNG